MSKYIYVVGKTNEELDPIEKDLYSGVTSGYVIMKTSLFEELIPEDKMFSMRTWLNLQLKAAPFEGTDEPHS